MRLFAAIPVGAPVDALLARLLDRWKSNDWPVKWVRPEGLHLTLKFLGSVEADLVAPIKGSLAEAIAGTPRLSFTLTDLGGFPSVAKARVVWAGLESEAALELMVHRVEQASARLGFPLEGRPYRPHVTLGRLREGRRLPAAAIREIEGVDLTPVSFTSEAVVLYHSQTGPGDSRYEALATFPLGAR